MNMKMKPRCSDCGKTFKSEADFQSSAKHRCIAVSQELSLEELMALYESSRK